MTSNFHESTILIWLADERYFSIKLNQVVGLSFAENAEIIDNEIRSSDLSGARPYNSKIRIFREKKESHSNLAKLNLLLVQSSRSELAINFTKIVYQGPAETIPSQLDKPIFSIGNEEIDRHGLAKEAHKAEVQAHSAETKKDGYVLFHSGQRSLALSFQNTVKIASQKDIFEFPLVSDKAIGYLRVEEDAVPTISFEDSTKGSLRAIVSVINEMPFAFPIAKLGELLHSPTITVDDHKTRFISHSGEDWLILEPNEIISETELKPLYDGYKKVFGAGAGKTEGEADSNLQARILLQVDIGEKICVPFDLVYRIELFPEDWDEKAKSYSFQGKEIPFFNAGQHYGFSQKTAKAQNRRILIVFKNDAFVAIGVNSTDSILYIDRESEMKYGSWLFTDSNANFRNDSLSFVHASDYYRGNKSSLIYTSFDSFFARHRKAM